MRTSSSAAARKRGSASKRGSARRSATVERNTLHYAADTAAGQSGAPVWRLDPRTQQRVVVGIHTGGARTGNSATRITSRVFANLRRWCRRAADSREDPPR